MCGIMVISAFKNSQNYISNLFNSYKIKKWKFEDCYTECLVKFRFKCQFLKGKKWSKNVLKLSNLQKNFFALFVGVASLRTPLVYYSMCNIFSYCNFVFKPLRTSCYLENLGQVVWPVNHDRKRPALWDRSSISPRRISKPNSRDIWSSKTMVVVPNGR